MAIILREDGGEIAQLSATPKKIILSATLGGAGWSPILALVPDGNRMVFQVTAWTGGSGIPPPSGGYIGSSGLVPLISDAVSVRGIQGVNGLSAYQLALDNGFVGTEQDWLDSLRPQWETTNW